MASSWELQNRRGLPHKNPFRNDNIKPDVEDLYIKVKGKPTSTNYVITVAMATGARDCLERLLQENDPVRLRELAETQLDNLNRYLEP